MTWARDPLEAERCLAAAGFDVAVVDMLYEHLTFEFDRRRLARAVTPTSASFLVSGLYAIAAFRRANPDGGVVVWTSGEANRRLHLLFAFESLGVRTFCSKSSGTGKADVLHRTILSACAGEDRVDPVLNSYLPAPGSPTISETVLRDELSRAIWRALALGHHTREEIAAVTGYAKKTIGNATAGPVHDRLRMLDPGLPAGGRPLPELVFYAGRNWEFFLDEAVRRTHP